MSLSPSAQMNSYRGYLPILALLISAALWGSSWYPFRLLIENGIAGLWGMITTQLIAAAICLIYFRHELLTLRWSRQILAVGLFGGICNASYVMGTIEGEVMRVTLLLYLSPLWTLILARWLLHEYLNLMGMMIVALSLIGAMLILLPLGTNASSFGVGDIWGLVSGMAFAVYIVLIRRQLELVIAHKVFAVMIGTAMVASVFALFEEHSIMHQVSGFSWAVIIGVAAMLVLNGTLQQYGLERLNATRASVFMMSELIFATLFAWWWADEVPSVLELLGGTLIVLAGILSSGIVTVSSRLWLNNFFRKLYRGADADADADADRRV